MPIPQWETHSLGRESFFKNVNKYNMDEKLCAKL